MAAVIVFERVLELTLAVEPVYFYYYSRLDVRRSTPTIFMSILSHHEGIPQRRVEVLRRCGMDAETCPVLYASAANVWRV